MKIEEGRPGVYRVTAAANELSVLVAGARMALNLMESEEDHATRSARDSLARVLDDFDAALERSHAPVKDKETHP